MVGIIFYIKFDLTMIIINDIVCTIITSTNFVINSWHMYFKELIYKFYDNIYKHRQKSLQEQRDNTQTHRAPGTRSIDTVK